MLKLFAVSLLSVNLFGLASEPDKDHLKDNLTDQISKCIKRELAIHTGSMTPSISEKIFGSGCYKWITSSRSSSTVLINKCNTDDEFSALLAKQYCTKQVEN